MVRPTAVNDTHYKLWQ